MSVYTAIVDDEGRASFVRRGLNRVLIARRRFPSRQPPNPPEQRGDVPMELAGDSTCVAIIIG